MNKTTHRILWLAVAEARGHLMRARLIRELLAPAGITVDIATTKASGRRFLADAGVSCTVLPGGFELIYDDRQNLQVERSRRAFQRYAARGAIADMRVVARWAARYDLLVNDSFHPALASAALVSAAWRRKIVDVYGENLHAAVLAQLDRQPASFRFLFERALSQSRAHVVHTLEDCRFDRSRLPPLLAEPQPLHRREPLAAVYLNPRFSDPTLATSIERAVRAAGLELHAVGEGFAGRPGWRPTDPALADVVAGAEVLIAAPGMGSLGQAHAYGTPLIALVSDQPEQRMNLRFLPANARPLFIDVPAFERELARAIANRAPRRPHHATRAIRARWRETFVSLVETTQNLRRQAA